MDNLKLYTIFWLGLVLILSACSTTSFQTHTDVLPEADFSSYKTFSWISSKPLIQQAGGIIVSPLNAQRIQTTVGDKFTELGYQFVPNSDNPDFTVSFTVGTREKLDVYTYYPSHYHRNPWRWPGYYHDDVRVHDYTVGTLAIDVFDYASGKPVWHGVATKTVLQSDINNPTPVIQEAVNTILNQFPK